MLNKNILFRRDQLNKFLPDDNTIREFEKLISAANQVIGVGQTWQTLTTSRVLGTTYTNDTGKPIQVIVVVQGTADVANTVTVGGIVISRYDIGITRVSSHSFIVPNNTTYVVSSTSSTLLRWSELR